MNIINIAPNTEPGRKLRLLTVALLAAMPALALAAPFEKEYTESMTVQDEITMVEAKQALVDKLRLDALNDAGARLKSVTKLTQTGDTETKPTSTFSKTMASQVHVKSIQYLVGTNKNKQTELTATARIAVDDAELLRADDEERKVEIQQKHIAQIEQENKNLKARLAVQVVSPPVSGAGSTSSGQSTQGMRMPYADEVSGYEDEADANKSNDSGSLSKDERNNNDLTPEQKVRFDQLCERFKAVDQMIDDAGVQSSYIGTEGSNEQSFGNGNSIIHIGSSIRVTWDWTKEMEIIRHLMGNTGTINGNIYTVYGNEVNDKAVLVAVRKCDRANTISVFAKGDKSGVLTKPFLQSLDFWGNKYRLVFKGDYVVNVNTDVGRDRGKLIDGNKPISYAVVSDFQKNMQETSSQNRLFGTDHPPEPNRFGYFDSF